MSKKKGKFDLSHLVHEGQIKDGDTLYFVSEPAKCFTVKKQPNGDYKAVVNGEVTTVHAFAQKCLGTEPPDHASRWFRNEKGVTLYQMWQADAELDYAA